MTFPEVVKAALELGVIPTLALFLVAGLFLQNRQLIKDRREMETKLLNSLLQVVSDYREVLAKPPAPQLPERATQKEEAKERS